MDKNKAIIIVNLSINARDDGKYEDFIEEIAKHHRRINYHMDKIDKHLGFIDDVINGYDGDFEDNWLA